MRLWRIYHFWLEVGFGLGALKSWQTYHRMNAHLKLNTVSDLNVNDDMSQQKTNKSYFFSSDSAQRKRKKTPQLLLT